MDFITLLTWNDAGNQEGSSRSTVFFESIVIVDMVIGKSQRGPYILKCAMIYEVYIFICQVDLWIDMMFITKNQLRTYSTPSRNFGENFTSRLLPAY